MPVSVGDARFIKGHRIDGNPSNGQVPVFDAAGKVFFWRDFFEISENVVIVYVQVFEVLSTDPRPENPVDGTLIFETDTGRAFVFISPEWRQIGASRHAETISRTNERNIQLLFLQQAKLLEVSAGLAVDGFFDALEDIGGIDTNLTTGSYSEVGRFYEGIIGGGLQTATLTVSNLNQFVRSNDRGLIRLWAKDSDYSGHFEGAETAFTVGACVDRGSGKVGFPAQAHGLTVGEVVRFYGFVNEPYNNIFAVDGDSTVDEIVVSASFVAENIPENSRFFRRIPSLGVGRDCPDVVTGSQVASGGVTVQIEWIDQTSHGAGFAKVQLSQTVSTGAVDLVTGPVVEDGSLTLKSVFDPEGSRNTSVTNAVPNLINNSGVTCSSETVGYEAWKIFNGLSGATERWLSAAGNTTGWVRYDFGSGNAKVINKYRWRTMESDSNAVPGAWDLQGSNDDTNWATLHSGTNTVQTGNTWIGYFEFRNSQAFRYYRFNVTANCGHATFLVCDELELIGAPAAVSPTGIHPVILSETYRFNCVYWDQLITGTITEFKPGSSAVFYAVSFDAGTAWKIFKNGVWREIARDNDGQWQYMNASDVWTDALTNSPTGALREAANVATNRMDAVGFGAITSEGWVSSGGWSNSVEKINLAIILQGSGAAIPGVSSAGLSYYAADTDIDVVTTAYEADDWREFDRVTVGVLVKNKTESTKVFVSSGEERDWTEIGPLIKQAGLANGVEFYCATNDSYEPDGFDMRLRVHSDVGHDTELHGFALNWG